MLHKLKTLPKYYEAIIKGDKTFEVRIDDRDYQVNDTLILQKFNNNQYLYDDYEVKIIYILGRNEDEKMFVPQGYVILGIK